MKIFWINEWIKYWYRKQSGTTILKIKIHLKDQVKRFRWCDKGVLYQVVSQQNTRWPPLKKKCSTLKSKHFQELSGRRWMRRWGGGGNWIKSEIAGYLIYYVNIACLWLIRNSNELNFRSIFFDLVLFCSLYLWQDVNVGLDSPEASRLFLDGLVG